MVHRDDLADLYVRAAESGLGGEVLNATDRSRATVNECAAAASLAAGAEGRVEHVPVEQAVAAMGPFATCLALNQHVDSWKAVHRLGWTPRHGGFVDAAPRLYSAVEGGVGRDRRDGAAAGLGRLSRPDGRGRAPASRLPLGRRRLDRAQDVPIGPLRRLPRWPTGSGDGTRNRAADPEPALRIRMGRTIRRTVLHSAFSSDLPEFDHYHVSRVLGEGGMGIVFLAEDRRTRLPSPSRSCRGACRTRSSRPGS